MVTPTSVGLGNESNLKIYAQNIRDLGNKTDELVINWVKDTPHKLCLSEHHLSIEVIQSIIVDDYNWVHITVGNSPNMVMYVYFFINLISS